ncbi:ABC transporter permease [Pseudogracilibacillus sp. SO30301A]|uniref:ABC transporter permease n=1 Tax=Pseudogracilibacillus sp. SO30301A TaxID=3098291 RepID=UPI00300DFAFE
MIGKLIITDFMKIKRKGFWFLTFLGPFGVVALQMVNYGVRKEYLFTQSDDRWGYYLMNTSTFTPLAIVLGIAILTSAIASIETETNAWKQLLSLPVPKKTVFISKFFVLASLFLVASILLTIFTLGYGMFLDLGKDIPYVDLIKYSFYPYFAALPILALQLWIAIVSNNQGIPITTGILGTILTYSSFTLPDWMIWKWPALMMEWDDPTIIVMFGFGFGFLIFIIGMIDFVRRDVK